MRVVDGEEVCWEPYRNKYGRKVRCRKMNKHVGLCGPKKGGKSPYERVQVTFANAFQTHGTIRFLYDNDSCDVPVLAGDTPQVVANSIRAAINARGWPHRNVSRKVHPVSQSDPFTFDELTDLAKQLETDPIDDDVRRRLVQTAILAQHRVAELEREREQARIVLLERDRAHARAVVQPFEKPKTTWQLIENDFSQRLPADEVRRLVFFAHTWVEARALAATYFSVAVGSIDVKASTFTEVLPEGYRAIYPEVHR